MYFRWGAPHAPAWGATVPQTSCNLTEPRTKGRDKETRDKDRESEWGFSVFWVEPHSQLVKSMRKSASVLVKSTRKFGREGALQRRHHPKMKNLPYECWKCEIWCVGTLGLKTRTHQISAHLLQWLTFYKRNSFRNQQGGPCRFFVIVNPAMRLWIDRLKSYLAG